MRAIGLFRELNATMGRDVLSLHDVAGALSLEEAEAVSSYLATGITVFDVMEVSVDPLDRSKRFPGGASLVSDGFWVWRQDLGYFVDVHRIALPHEFLTEVRRKGSVKVDEIAVVNLWEEAIAAYNRAEQGIVDRD